MRVTGETNQQVSCAHVFLCVLSSQNAFLEREVASLRSELDTSARRAEAQEEELRVICDESVIIPRTVRTQQMMSHHQGPGLSRLQLSVSSKGPF